MATSQIAQWWSRRAVALAAGSRNELRLADSRPHLPPIQLLLGWVRPEALFPSFTQITPTTKSLSSVDEATESVRSNRLNLAFDLDEPDRFGVNGMTHQFIGG